MHELAVPLWRQIFSYRYLLNSVYLQSKAKKMSSFECAQLAGTVTLPYKVSLSGNESIPSTTHVSHNNIFLILAIVFMFYYLSPEKVAEDVKITVPCVNSLNFANCILLFVHVYLSIVSFPKSVWNEATYETCQDVSFPGSPEWGTKRSRGKFSRFSRSKASSRKFLPPKIFCWRAEDAEQSVFEPQIQ